MVVVGGWGEVVVVGGGEWLWVLLVGGSPVDISDMSKLVRTYINTYIYMYLRI